MVSLSLVVITFNEAQNIGRCIRSMEGLADEVVVVDSGSTDDTVAIAQSLGARVLHQSFLGYIEQKRFAISQAVHPFVLLLDADEALSPELQASVLAAKNNWRSDCYSMNRVSCVGDKWLRHGSNYPDRKVRLFDKNRYMIRGINPHDEFAPAPGATVSHLKGDILHYTNTSIADRMTSVNRLSSVAADAYYQRGKRSNYLRLLVKPGARFWSEFLIRRGFLDGFYGWVFATSSAWYVFLREAKLIELQQNSKKNTQ